MGPFSVFTAFVSVFGAVDKTSSSFSAHGKIGNFIIIMGIFAGSSQDRGRYSDTGFGSNSHFSSFAAL